MAHNLGSSGIVVQSGLHSVDKGFIDDGAIKPLENEIIVSFRCSVHLLPSPKGVGLGIIDLGVRLVYARGQLSELKAFVRGYALEYQLEVIPVLAL